jgi:hypothetical protein
MKEKRETGYQLMLVTGFGLVGKGAQKKENKNI